MIQSQQRSHCSIFLEESFHASVGLLLLSITVNFSLFSLCIFLLRQKLWCNCSTCHSYLTSNWSKQFVNLSDWYAHLLQKSSRQTVRLHVLRSIITANPENVEYMLKTRFSNYPKGKPFSAILGDLLGDGIFNVDGDSWMFQRKMASLELGSLSIRSYAFANVNSEIKCRLLPLLSSVAGDVGGVLDLQDVLRRFSFDNICKFSFGLDPGCLELSLPVSHFAEFFDLATKLSAERALAPSPLVWKIKRLRDIVISFVLAGRDTVASALTSFFWLLTNHPEVVSRIREESSGAIRFEVRPGR